MRHLGRGGAGVDGGALEIVQVVRRLQPGGGVGGAAFALDAAFRARGLAGPPITAQALRPGRRTPSGRWGAAAEIVSFTLRATAAARRASRRGAVVVVHGDALGGDIYVDHGLHRALVRRRPWLLLHPLHLFIAGREAVRHRRRGTTRLACLSQAGADELRAAYPALAGTPIALVSNGVDLRRFRPDPERLAGPVDPERLRLAFIGHEFRRKGLRHVLDALTLLPEGVTLAAVGGRPGTLEAARRRAARLGVAGRVEFLGVRTDVEAVLRGSDLLVLPSSREAAPLVVLEAMASGVPVLISGVPAAPELIGPEGEGGRVIEASGSAIAAAVRELAADPARFAALRRAAVARAQRFGWAEVAEGYVALAEAVRDARRRRPPA